MSKHGSHGIRTTGKKWQRMRSIVLKEEPLCRICDGKGQVTPSAEVDHIVPLARKGTDNRDNLQGVCIECHKAKTAVENGYQIRKTIGLDGYESEGVGGFEN